VVLGGERARVVIARGREAPWLAVLFGSATRRRPPGFSPLQESPGSWRAWVHARPVSPAACARCARQSAGGPPRLASLSEEDALAWAPRVGEKRVLRSAVVRRRAVRRSSVDVFGVDVDVLAVVAGERRGRGVDVLAPAVVGRAVLELDADLHAGLAAPRTRGCGWRSCSRPRSR